MHEETTKPAIVIDTCIWIDLAKAGILQEAFSLPYKLIDPDLIVQEEVRPTNWHKLANLGLNFIPASVDEVVEVSRIRNANRNISFYDASVLELAKRLAVTLVTDDGSLTKVARNFSVPVEGITWLLNEMVIHNCITGTEATIALHRINQSGHVIQTSILDKYKKMWETQ
jgi:predicted nucleic acid-binding protein